MVGSEKEHEGHADCPGILPMLLIAVELYILFVKGDFLVSVGKR